MEKRNAKIEYRMLNDSESSPWQPLGNVDELIWDGVCAIRATGDEGTWGLPFHMDDNDMVNIVVKDYVPEANNQNSRIIVQTLTRVERSTGSVYTYSRTRRYKDGMHTWNEWSRLDGESTGSALLPNGIVTAEKLADDIRKNVENPLRPLYIAAGALYNDTDEIIKRTAFWGEEVDHLPHHYYLNGLGDITEEQMMFIYDLKDTFYNMSAAGSAERWFQNYKDTRLRTIIPILRSRRAEFQFFTKPSCAFTWTNVEILKWSNDANWSNAVMMSGNISLMFQYTKKLIVIDSMDFNLATNVDLNLFQGCAKLKYFRIKNLKTNISFVDSPNINKDSIINLILNSANTVAISITLHVEAYNRFVEDLDIVSALETKPLVTLVSA